MVKQTHVYRFDKADINAIITDFLRQRYGVPEEMRFDVLIGNVQVYDDEGASAGSRQEIVATQIDR